jgi:hypothetical protein
MPELRMTTAISHDNSSVTVEFLPASGATGKLTLSAPQLLLLIQALGRVHANMIHDRPIPDFDVRQIDQIFNTKWSVLSETEKLPEVSALAFYHPAFGPVCFAIPHEQAREIARLMSLQIEVAARNRPKPN